LLFVENRDLLPKRADLNSDIDARTEECPEAGRESQYYVDPY
jgi:hypothetical protein